jgi:four helix bundle protein
MQAASETAARPFDICERTFLFALDIVQLCRRLEQVKSSVNWALLKQLVRSGTSIGANIEEGQAGQSRADFIAKYSIARKEARETRYWLRLFQSSGILTADDAQPLVGEADALVRILTTIIRKASQE